MSTISDLAKAAAGRCWDGYEPVPGKDAYSDDSCRKIGSKKKKKSEKKANFSRVFNKTFPKSLRISQSGVELGHPIGTGLLVGAGLGALADVDKDGEPLRGLDPLRGMGRGVGAATGASLGLYPGMLARRRLGGGKSGLLAMLATLFGGGVLGSKLGGKATDTLLGIPKTPTKKADDCHCYPGGPADPDKKGCKDPDCDHCGKKEGSDIQALAKAAASAAWQRKAGKNSKGGLNEKGRKSYERENPGSDLKAPVTGKVKPGGKAAKRRKSFCARMKGNKGPMKKPNGEPTRKALALRKWKC